MNERAVTAAYTALGLCVLAVSALRGLVAWADYQAKPPGPRTSPRPPRHPHKETS